MSTPMTTVFASPDDLAAAVGTHLGYSAWVEIDQARIDEQRIVDRTEDGRWAPGPTGRLGQQQRYATRAPTRMGG